MKIHGGHQICLAISSLLHVLYVCILLFLLNILRLMVCLATLMPSHL